MSKRDGVGTSLVVQWLRLCTSTAENSSSISDGEWLIKIHKIYIYMPSNPKPTSQRERISASSQVFLKLIY